MILDKDVKILDVRTAEEYSEGHLSNAENIDFYAEDFTEQILALPKEEEYVLYCRSGRRSNAALQIMQEAGYDVVEIAGGIQAWNAEGFPVEE